MEYNINKFSNNKFTFLTSNEIKVVKSINPNKTNLRNNFIPISFNNDNIFINNQQYNLSYFYNHIYSQKNKYIVLHPHDVYSFKYNNIYCLKDILPFLKYDLNLSYNYSLNEEYLFIKKTFNKYSSLISFKQRKYNSIQHQYKTYLAFKQNRKIHFKSLLDNNFFFSIKSGFSDVFKLLDNRPNRSIFQLDVNSMYPFAMIQDNFSIPRNLEYHSINNLTDILSNKISNGIFNCQLSIKKDLSNKQKNFIKYLPINLIENNISIPLHIKFGDKINILLHANEIKFYSKYFDIILEDGIYSKKSMNHPLKNWVLETYQKRLNSTGSLKDFYKFILTVSHSVIMGNSKINNVVENYQEFLYNEYQFETNDIQNNAYFQVEEFLNIYNINSYDIYNEYNIYSLYSQVLANARIHLLELYEKIYSESSSFELCYCNIDSLHISIPNELSNEFNIILDEISSKTELGKLKIESIGDKGIWFEPGRYWLFKDNQLISYKNTIFNDDNNDYKCTFKTIFKKKEKSNFNLFNCLQLKKKIERLNENHFVFKKTHSIYNILENKIKNKKIYFFIFKNFIDKN